MKSVSMVQEGVWKDVKPPKCLPSVSDGIICGVCRAPVDIRALIASRKEAKRLDYEKPHSMFQKGGSFVNPSERKVSTLRSTKSVVIRSSSKSKPQDTRLSRRTEASTPSGAQEVSVEDLKPQKMERLNVQRTTRWLACIAQVIRLVLEGTTKERAIEETSAITTEAFESSREDTKEQSKSVPSPGAHGQTEKLSVGGGESIEGDKDKHMETTPRAGEAKTSSLVAPTSEVEKDANYCDEKERQGEKASPTVAAVACHSPIQTKPSFQVFMDEAKKIVEPFDAYAYHKISVAEEMLHNKRGPGLCVLRELVHEYTRFVYMKHVRAVEKASAEKRKRQEQVAQEERERERKRLDREAEIALKQQMLALRKRQRRSAPATSTTGSSG